MTTPVPTTRTTGSRGELKAAVIFADIGWAPPVKLSEDIGTDLVTFARDNSAPEEKEHSWDLGAPVFMQVKGSDTEYLKPAHKRNGEQGWWFSETGTYHFDHWLSFGLPYLLVLVDTENQIGYWAEVTGEAIVSTGKGRKIFVPVDQTVDVDHLEALNQVAVSRRKYALEGTAWKGALSGLGPSDRLRNALLVPRLVAPHPNRSVEKVEFEEAAAMVMRNRHSELVHRAGQGQCPAPDAWETHRDWGWRFVHALHELVTHGAGGTFEQLALEARHRYERDACLIIDACANYTRHKVADALASLVTTSATRPADRGWHLIHRAALLLELDQPVDAAAAAKKALVAAKALDGDLSVSVIRGAAASLLYSVAGFAAGDLGATITAQDNAGSWWRAQDISWALQKDLELRFQVWTSDDTHHVVVGAAGDDLATVAWNAAFSGSWASWRHLTAMKVQLTLPAEDDSIRVAEALRTLVYLGERKEAKNAARKIWMDGPFDALQKVLELLAYEPWSKRDEGPAMGVFTEAGDLLDAAAADHVIDRVIELLTIGGRVRHHGSGWADRWGEADGALRRVLKAATPRAHKSVADFITAEFPGCDDPVAHSLVRVASAVNMPCLGATRVNRLVRIATARTDRYSIDLLEIAAPHSAAALTELRAQADAGNQRAVRSLLVAGSNNQQDFLVFGRGSARTVRSMVQAARGEGGTIQITDYVNDPLDDLTIAAINTGDTKLWKEVTDSLESCVLEQTQQQDALRRLASRFHTLPPHVQGKLREIAPNLHGPSLASLFGKRNEYSAAVVQLRIAAGTVPDLEVEALLLSERKDDPVGFVRTLGAWDSDRKLPFLATTVVDDNPRVRAQAGFDFVKHAHQYPADCGRAFAILESALMQDRGCALADGIAQGLVAYPDTSLAHSEELLRNHPSAVVRARFQQERTS